jgi:hypothetical protein
MLGSRGRFVQFVKGLDDFEVGILVFDVVGKVFFNLSKG